MNLVYESTDKFEKDLSSFQKQEVEHIMAAVNRYGAVMRENSSIHYPNVYRPMIIQLKGSLDATLYVLRISRDIRAILIVDDDPMFDRTIIRLLRVVRINSVNRVFRGIAESVYQGILEKIRQKENQND
jgi:hypothetical protein